jgi:hypothetical protein
MKTYKVYGLDVLQAGRMSENASLPVARGWSTQRPMSAGRTRGKDLPRRSFVGLTVARKWCRVFVQSVQPWNLQADQMTQNASLRVVKTIPVSGRRTRKRSSWKIVCGAPGGSRVVPLNSGEGGPVRENGLV